jgi:drug/metabolite transporter (DMT)-like permease
VLDPFAPQFVTETVAAPPSALAVVIYLGIFPTAIAFSTWAYALARTNAGPMTATTLAVPAIAVVLSWMLLGEVPTVIAMAGGLLCILGVAITRRR